jgi:sugar lactone lactonase YvrE
MKYKKILFAMLCFVVAISFSLFAQAPLSTNMAASGVLGTTDFVTNTGYASPSTTTLAEPAGVAIDPTTGKLFVADRDNRRVLRFSSAAKMINGSAAEAVLGQPDFVTRTRNTGGLSASTTNDPNAVCVDGSGRLWVADMTNNRVLRFDNASTIASVSSANGVLGQPDFVTNSTGLTASKMNTPTSVYVDGNGTLWVADRANNRVLRFANAAAKANGAAADGVLGQADFVTATTGLTASTMNTPWGVHVDFNGRLWVADRLNNRVLRFDNASAKSNGGSADGVLGEPDFTTSVYNTTQGGLGEPRGVAVDGLGRLYVADEGNTRVMIFNNAAGLANGANADNVLGQPDFITASSATTATGLNYALSIFIDNANSHIWIPDVYNHRILRFDVTPLPVELVSFTATVRSGKVELSWATATEVNNAGFAIEKNTKNVWNKIGYVEGNGNSNAPKNYSFTDNASAGKYQYRLKQIDRDGKFEYSNVVEAFVALTANDYTLGQNFPNPFNPSTTITFAMKNTEHATVTVHNMLGQEVAVLFNGLANANEIYSLSFDARNLSSGMYFYSLRSANRNEVKKMSLLK